MRVAHRSNVIFNGLVQRLTEPRAAVAGRNMQHPAFVFGEKPLGRFGAKMQSSALRRLKVGLAELVAIAHGQHQPIGQWRAKQFHQIERKGAPAVIELVKRAEKAVESEPLGKAGQLVPHQGVSERKQGIEGVRSPDA